jgi:hypothetical protein
MKDPVPLTPRKLGASLWTGPRVGRPFTGRLVVCLAVTDG